MEPPPEPPPINPNPQVSPTPPHIAPDIPFRRTIFRPSFPEPDPIRAAPEGYLPSQEKVGTYARQLREELQELVRGPLEYKMTSPLDSWNEPSTGIQQRDVDTAAWLITTVLDAGPHATGKNPTPLRAGDWGTLATACLAATARGFARPLKEATRN